MTDSISQPPSEPFRPTAPLETLKLRSELLAITRNFFRSHGFWEVETPILSRDVVVDAYLEPFVTRADVGPSCRPTSFQDELFLQTSPEFGMKRLMASGAKAIVQITRAFRRGEIGPRHNPEFTIVEWYRAGTTYQDEMSLVEEFVSGFFEQVRAVAVTLPRTTAPVGTVALPRPFERITYDAAFEQVLGRRVIGLSAVELAGLAKSRGIEAPPSLARDDVDGWLNLLLALEIEPVLAQRRAVFIYDYPPGQAALARIRSGAPDVAERFELYVNGTEICNGYQELTDPDELRRRIAVQSAVRCREGNRPLPAESLLLDAMEFGLPDCAGVALGFDRLLMAAIGASTLADVVAFPFERA